MAVSVTHSTVATLPDEPGAEVNKTEWNAPHTVTGLGTFADQNFATPPAIGGTTPAAGTFTALIANTSLTVGDGSAATVTLASNLSGSNDGAVVLADNGVRLNPIPATTTAWHDNLRFTVGSGIAYGWSASAGLSASTADTSMYRAAANSIQFGGNAVAAGAATSRTEINKTVTAFTDAVAKATFTVTIPNAAHSATLEFEITAFIGAGGAIGTNEAVATTSGKVVITRTPGVNAVAVASAAFGAAAAAVAGATTATVAAAVSAIAGAVGATNTFTLDVTITKGGGASANHVALCYGKIMNANASGITIA